MLISYDKVSFKKVSLTFFNTCSLIYKLQWNLTINFSYLSQIKASVDEIVRKETKTAQPTLWCALEDGNMLDQAFIIVDKAVFLELSNISYLNALLALISVYFAFNLSYDKRQELVFQFVEEFKLGLRPAKKSLRYHTMCMLLVPDK